MAKNSILKGVFLIGIGATSYGMLATIVKLAYAEGYTTAEVTLAQLLIGVIGMLIIIAFQNTTANKEETESIKATPKNIFHLMLAGTPLGFTNIFIYMAINYIPVSIAIVLLMQSVWMGVVFEMFLEKKIPSFQKIIAAIIVMIGTVFATNLLESTAQLNWIGVLYGLLSAVSFTTTLITANSVAPKVAHTHRSLHMLIGGTFIALIYVFIAQTTPFQFDVFFKWGIILAFLGTIIPPLFFNIGFPLTGIGLGSIVSALELPVSVMMAYFILNEEVNTTQWIGNIVIILAIVLMNVDFKPFLKR
jgi:drug/metabolite transporter (DMT)-like permease